MQKKLFIALVALGTMTLAGCGRAPAQPTYPDLDPALNGQMVADFSQGKSSEIFASDGWSNGQPFNAVWKKQNISYSDGKMKLTIKQEQASSGGVDYPYTAAEARSKKLYGYGDYLVSMKPSNVPGSVSTFFTYTGAGTVTDGTENVWNEIDIEFLGSNTRQVQFNYYENGRTKGHEYLYNLSFDASQDFHTYGFRWEENKISWVVDGKTVHQVTGTKDSLPSQSGRIMASYWPSSADSWSGHYYHRDGATCEYQWIKTSAQSRYADGEAPVDDSNVNWDNITPFTEPYWGGTNYTVADTEGGVNVTYSKTGAWECIGTYIGAQAAGAELANITLKNNGPTESAIKVDVQGQTTVGNHKVINTAASSKTLDAVTTDLVWGGSKFSLEPNQEAQVIIKFDQTTTRGTLENIAFFIDSLQDAEKAHAGGNITIKNIKLAKVDGTPVEPQAQGGSTPDAYDWSSVQPTYVQIDAWSAAYSVAHDQANFTETVTYSAAGDWACVGGSIKAAAANNNTLKVTLKNNSASESKVRIDIQAKVNPSAESGTIVNKGAYAANHSEVDTPDGSKITLAANEEVDFYIAYQATETTGPVENIVIFLDSTHSGSVAHEGGSVSFKNFKFADLTGGQGGGDEEEMDIPTEFDANAVALSFDSNPSYTISPRNTASKYLNVSYDNLEANYQTFWADYNGFEGKTTFSITAKNFGTSVLKFRVDVEGTTEVTVGPNEHNKCLNVSAVCTNRDGVFTDDTWGGSFVEIAAGETVTMTVTFDQTTAKGPGAKIVLSADANRGSGTWSGRLQLKDFIFA